MQPTTAPRLLTQDELRAAIDAGETPGWVGEQYAFFRESMLGNGTDHGDGEAGSFPCYFGVEAERNGDALYTYCPSTTDEAALAELGATLYTYTKRFREAGDRVSLVTFFGPDEDDPTDERGWFERFWSVLQFLHDHDPEPWPYDIPADPTDTDWEWCFGGEPIFPTARAPFYERRRSRLNPHGLEITFQPRAIFAGITGDTAAGKAARRTIRSRLERYDDAPPHPDLGDWGHAHEWKQYLLPDGEGSHDRPPIEVTKP